MAGGNTQRDFISKEDASSPTVATESVLLTSIIDAEEGRDAAVIDIPNAFIQARIEDEKDMAIIRIHGVLVHILCDITPDVYKPYVSTNPPTEEFGMPTEEFGNPVLTRSLVYDSRELYSRIADGPSDPPSCATDCTTGAESAVPKMEFMVP